MTHTRSEARRAVERARTTPLARPWPELRRDPNTVRRIARLADVGPGGPGARDRRGSRVPQPRARGDRGEGQALEIDRTCSSPARVSWEPDGVEVLSRQRARGGLRHHLEDTRGRRRREPALQRRDAPRPAPARGEPLIARMLVMVQKEVGERLAAHAGDEAYGAASLRVQYFADARVVGKVGPTVFVPKPNVDSALVSIVRRSSASPVDPALVMRRTLFEVIRTVVSPATKDARAGRSRGGRARGYSNARDRRDAATRGVDARGVRAPGGEPMIELRAPAKLTWILEVTGRRDDGHARAAQRDDHARFRRPTAARGLTVRRRALRVQRGDPRPIERELGRAGTAHSSGAARRRHD